jgi:hypothetical protein
MTEQLDSRRAEAFNERMLAALNSAALILLASLGHRTGLFDAMACAAPATSPKSPNALALSSATCASGWAAWS